MFKASEWNTILEVGQRKDSFDWDISMGYVRFGSYGMTVFKLLSGRWCSKTVNDWRSKTCQQINNELHGMEWEVTNDFVRC